MDKKSTTVNKIPESSSGKRPSITDQFGRVFNYVRIAINERCNLRCVYCMPEEGVDFLPSEELLRTDEIKRLISIFSINGVRKIRFTGGEPLLHKEIIDMIHYSSQIKGIDSIHLTTNGLLLDELALPLFEAGLKGINISLDTLDHKKFERITRRKGLRKVIKGLHRVLDLPFESVKLNVVSMRDFNHMEFGDFIELTRELPLTIRFIELMPFDAHQIWKTGKFIGAELIEEEIRIMFPNVVLDSGTATEHKLFRIPGYVGKVGIIPAFTRSLCSNCNRIRLTADGKIRNCLYSDEEFDLKKLLRSIRSDKDIERVIRKAMRLKPEDGWFAQKGKERHRESMTQIGG